MNKNFTTYEQSNRLLAIGVPADTADCYYNVPVTNESEIHVLSDGKKVSDVEGMFKRIIHPDITIVPCWSAGKLMEIYLKCGEDYIVDEYGDESDENASLHFISHDAEKLVDMMISEIEDGEVDFSKLNERIC
jgi:hypothetical protein